MFIIKCPWCGDRDQTEFIYHGEVPPARPKNPNLCSEEQWGSYLFFHKNTKGIQYERWKHQYGCRQWFFVIRNTQLDHIYTTYKPSEKIPKVKL